MDWSIGAYERTAALLDGVSDVVIALASPQVREQVLDIACGTGNAALKAAALGADVVGVDAAPRLVRVATDRAAAERLGATFILGDAQSLPVSDASVDVALSVFGLIFAPDQQATAAEVVRVLRPGGRAVITGWVREGALAQVGAATARARAAAEPEVHSGPPAQGPTPVDWGDEGAVRALFAPHAVTLAFAAAEVRFAAASPEAYLREQADHHPLWLDTRAAVGEEAFAGLLQRHLAIFRAANEDPAAFRVTSRYLITKLARG